MTVTNRKMFNRGARNKVRQMGGIMASSEPLIQEVARFEPGGSVDTRETFESFIDEKTGKRSLSPETIERLLRRFGATMPSYDRRADAEYLYNFSGDPFVTGGSNFILGDPSVVKREGLAQRNQLRYKPDILAERDQLNRLQKARNIAGLAKRAGFNLNMPVQNKDDVINFINQVDPTFKLTRKSFDKLFGADIDPTIARKAGPTLGNVLRSLFLLPTAATLDIGKGIGEALFGETKAYDKDELRGLISGTMKTEPGVKIDLAKAALDLYQREVKAGKNPEAVAAEIKNISGFDVNAMAATKMRGIEDPTGIIGALKGEASGIQVADPQGLMASERAGQPPLSMPAETVRRIENKDIRAAEDALMQSKNIVDPQSSQGADIQSILQALDAAKAPGEREFRKEQEEEIYADAVARGRAEAADAAEAASEREFRKEQEKTIYEDAQSAEERAEIAEKESEEALNTKNLEKPKQTYGNFGKNIGSGSIDADQGAKDARLKQLIKEFTDNAPKYEGLDSGLALAKIGFMMASGESPNAIVNIANALNKGADMFMADDAKRKEFTRQVQLSGLQYGLGEISKIREDERARARFLFEKNYDLEYFTVKDVDEEGNETFRSIALSKRFIAENGLPPNVMNSDLTGKYMTLQAAIAKSTNDDLDAVRLKGKDLERIDDFRQGLTANVTNVISATNSIDLLKRFIEYNEDGQVVGIANGLETAWGKAVSAAGFTPDKKYTDREKAIADVAQVFQALIPLTLGKDQSANSISNFDVDRLARAYVGLNIDSKNPFALSFTAQAFITAQMQRQIRLFEREQEKNIRAINSKISNEGLVFFYGAGKDLRPLISVGEEELRRLQPYIDPDSDLGLGGLGVSGITGPILDYDSDTNLYSLAKRT